MTEIDTEQPPKADPETMVLRAAPARVARFRRGAVIGIAALGSTAIVGATWLALKPPTFGVVAAGPDRAEADAKLPADALAGAPTSYGEVPALGPPLPGDLGRPMLQAQRAGNPQALAANVVEAEGQRVAQRRDAERDRAAAERRSARESALLIPLSGNRDQTEQTTAVGDNAKADAAPPAVTTDRLALDPTRDPALQQHKVDFVATNKVDATANPHKLAVVSSPYTLTAGSVIAASLITGLNSDLPGLVTAQVTQNTYDSVTGRTVLIPQGSRLIGKYDSVVAFGQERALVIWQRLILPDGASVLIDNMPASDTRGNTGLSDRIDVHTWRLLKGVALSTLLGIGTELSIGGDSDLVRAVRQSAQQSGSRAGDQIVSKNLGIQPTLTVRPGWPLRIVVTKDIVLPPWRGL